LGIERQAVNRCDDVVRPDLDDARRMPSHTSSIIATFFIAPIHKRGNPSQYSCTSTI
jgi:hypothetical protein